MELDETMRLRRQIREMLLNSDELKNIESLKQKSNLSLIKKDCYNKLLDLKGEFESDEINTKTIDNLIISLNQIKHLLNKQLY